MHSWQNWQGAQFLKQAHSRLKHACCETAGLLHDLYTKCYITDSEVGACMPPVGASAEVWFCWGVVLSAEVLSAEEEEEEGLLRTFDHA